MWSLLRWYCPSGSCCNTFILKLCRDIIQVRKYEPNFPPGCLGAWLQYTQWLVGSSSWFSTFLSSKKILPSLLPVHTACLQVLWIIIPHPLSEKIIASQCSQVSGVGMAVFFLLAKALH